VAARAGGGLGEGTPLLLWENLPQLSPKIRITIFIRQQSNNQRLVRRRRQARDLLAIQRILITASVLIVLGIPSVILVILSAITGKEYLLSFRITWISLTVSMTGFSVAVFFSFIS
jgi:hypothetical protein